MEARDIEHYLAELGKDLADCAILLAQTKISTRQQAQQLLDQYITPKGQEKNAETIANSKEFIHPTFLSGLTHQGTFRILKQD